jgi:hypothetical protein
VPLEAGDEEVASDEDAGGTVEVGDITSVGASASAPSTQPRANDSQPAAQVANSTPDAQSSPSPAPIDQAQQAQAQAQSAGQATTPPATSANHQAGESGSPVSIPPGSLAAQSAVRAEGDAVAMDTAEEEPAPFSVFASRTKSMFANVGRLSDEEEVRQMALEAERERQAKRRAVGPQISRHFIPSNCYIPDDTGDAQPDFSVRSKRAKGATSDQSINEDVYEGDFRMHCRFYTTPPLLLCCDTEL